MSEERTRLVLISVHELLKYGGVKDDYAQRTGAAASSYIGRSAYQVLGPGINTR